LIAQYRKLATNLLLEAVQDVRAVQPAEHQLLEKLQQEREAVMKRCRRPKCKCKHHKKAQALLGRIRAIHAARASARWLRCSSKAEPWFEVAGVDYDQAMRQLDSEGLLYTEPAPETVTP
jgi:hypothetical protein